MRSPAAFPWRDSIPQEEILRRLTPDGPRLLFAACWVYFTALFAWLATFLATGQRLWLLELLDGASLWLFLPLPFALLIGAVYRRGKIVLAGTLAALFALSFWGWLFIPRTSPAHARGETLTVMTYNLLGPQEHNAAVLHVLRAEQPDVVLFQELNPQVAGAIEAELTADYPYQVLRPERGVRGMGVISRYPLRDTGESLDGSWVGAPQVLDLDWDGQEVRVLNFHLLIPPLSPHSAGRREAAAKVLTANAAEAMPRGAVIAAGDTNVTHLSDTYRTFAGVLEDSWGEAGYGFGHTWGGSIFTEWLRLPFPVWIVRIDYVFHSRDLHAVSAHTARFDNSSDHRGVVVTLARNPD